jgi:hypothetical protein
MRSSSGEVLTSAVYGRTQGVTLTPFDLSPQHKTLQISANFESGTRHIFRMITECIHFVSIDYFE